MEDVALFKREMVDALQREIKDLELAREHTVAKLAKINRKLQGAKQKLGGLE